MEVFRVIENTSAGIYVVLELLLTRYRCSMLLIITEIICLELNVVINEYLADVVRQWLSCVVKSEYCCRRLMYSVSA